MKKYRITYPEGISQEKNLLDKEEYEEVKNLSFRISELKQELSEINKRKKSEKWNEVNGKIHELDKQLSKYEEWFILESPLGKALQNGGHLILPTYKSDGSKHDHYPTTFEELG